MPLRSSTGCVDGRFQQRAVFAAGSSPLLASVCAWLAAGGVQEVFCVQPLYFSLVWNLKLHGIRARPVSGHQPYEPEFRMNLPERRTVLLLADPIWYAGLSVPAAAVGDIARWQAKTGSTVVVDGSFQYFGLVAQGELTAGLDPDLTVRLVCPTKALALHGHRFSYALAPVALADGIGRVLSMLDGSGSVALTACGRVALEEMGLGRVGAGLAGLARSRHSALRARGVIAAPWTPDCGYFTFERLEPVPAGPLMDGGFFGQKRFPASSG